MAVMCERVTLPPISSLDFAFSVDSRPRSGRNESSPRGHPSPPAPTSHARYDSQSSSWDAHRPSTSGRPFPTPSPKYQVDPRQRSRQNTFDSPTGQPYASSPVGHTRHASLGDRPHSPLPLSALSDSHHHRVSHVRTASQLSSISADTWSQYDSEHPDSPDTRLRSLSPGGAHYVHRAPGISTTPTDGDQEMRFIYSTPAGAGASRSSGKANTAAGSHASIHVNTSAAAMAMMKKRKVDDGCSSEDELAAGDAMADDGDMMMTSPSQRTSPNSSVREQADGKRKYKKMMNVRHYRAQTKDALQSLRDVLPESIRPLERQARSFTVVNAVKHIVNLTAQLDRLQLENQEQAERLQRADARERELVSKIVALENAIHQKDRQCGSGSSMKTEERAPVVPKDSDA